MAHLCVHNTVASGVRTDMSSSLPRMHAPSTSWMYSAVGREVRTWLRKRVKVGSAAWRQTACRCWWRADRNSSLYSRWQWWHKELSSSSCLCLQPQGGSCQASPTCKASKLAAGTAQFGDGRQPGQQHA